MDSFSEMGPSLTETPVTAVTKLFTSKRALDKHLNETSKACEEQKAPLTNQMKDLEQKNKPKNFKKARFHKIADGIQVFYKEIVVVSEGPN